jgi:hypothetical protein
MAIVAGSNSQGENQQPDAQQEIAHLQRQCLQARIPDQATLIEKVGAWESRCNKSQATVHWRFTTEDARIKLHKLYPSIDV